MSLLIVSATKESDYTTTLLYQSIVNIYHATGIKLEYTFIKNNSTGLSKCYNDYLQSPHKFVVFVHDDVWVDDVMIHQKLEKYSKEFDIMGVAGGINPKIATPTLWHLMCGRENLRGYANHFHIIDNKSVTYMSAFGASPARVLLLDGVFLAINTEKIGDWKFNEKYDFHCYDLASSLDANAKHLRLGVVPINVIHKSHGLSNIADPCFCKNQEQFLKEYAK